MEEARAYAHKRVGAAPELGSFYAVSGDGVGRIFMAGTTWAELFPALFPPKPEPAPPTPAWTPEDVAMVRAAGDGRCVCTDAELEQHGCSCWDPY